jgi:hypothetical protein
MLLKPGENLRKRTEKPYGRAYVRLVSWVTMSPCSASPRVVWSFVATTWIRLVSSSDGNTSDNSFSDLNFGPTVGGILERRSSMGKDACQRSRSDASIRSKWWAFFSLIRSLRMLIFSTFGILTVNIRSGLSPRTKQLSERNGVESRTTTVWTSSEELNVIPKRRLSQRTWCLCYNMETIIRDIGEKCGQFLAR